MTKRAPCRECGKRTAARHPILQVAVCRPCQGEKPDQYGLITKTRASQEYRLQPDLLSALTVFELPNPYWKSGPRPMQLFLHSQVRELARSRYGSDEPYLVTLATFTPELLEWLLEDLTRLREFSPDQFQFLIANRLNRLGLEAQLSGNLYAKDGGVDIVAYPRTPTVPFLLGVQVKHHRTDRKTGSGDIRNFHGLLGSRNSPFHMGVIVTNTAFTADAQWFAAQNQALMRLRDLSDLRRWLKEDFSNDAEWREIPRKIELAPTVSIDIPRPGRDETARIGSVSPNKRMQRATLKRGR